MIPSPAEVVRLRATAGAAVRFVGVLCLTWASLGLASQIEWAIRAANSYGGYDVSWTSLAISALFTLMMLTLVAFPRRWAAWMVPFSDATRCPFCRYPMRGLTEPRCPECGLQLSEEFVTGVPAPGSALAFRVRVRAAMLPVVRLVGLLLLLIFAIDAITEALGILFTGPSAVPGFAVTAYHFVATAIGVVMVVRPEPFAHWLVFGRRREPDEP